ncbi:MAG: T9SS type A sorting domain-containing protein [Nitrososphaerales archaeon]
MSKKIIQAMFLVLGFIATAFCQTNNGSWFIATLDSIGDVGMHTSIAIDSRNNVHISYRDLHVTESDLKYATNASGSWICSKLDSLNDVGWHSSIAIDSDDKVHISYFYATYTDNLKYITNSSGSWVDTTIDTEGNTGWSTSIGIDSNNKIHIAYYNKSNGALRYATNSSGTWVCSTIDYIGVAEYQGAISLAIDSNNKVHISYFDNTNADLKYATNASGTWVCSSLETIGSLGAFNDIAIDSKNSVHIAYLDDTNGKGDLKYATNASGSWIFTTLDSIDYVGWWASIAIDSNDKVHIGYYDGTNSNLKYATNTSGSWCISTIDSIGSVGGYVSIAIDHNNKVHISYRDQANADLKYATNAFEGETPILQFSDQLQLSPDGYRPDIVFDKKSSSIYVVYEGWRDIYPEIFITKSTDNGKTFSSPVPVTKQTAGIIERPAIAIDTSGNIHIVYNDANSYIAYCKSTDGGNTFSTPVRISDAHSSVIDRPRITYFGNNVYVVWRYDESDYRIYLDRSINGANFGTDVQVNDLTSGTRGYPDISIGTDEVIYVVWRDNGHIKFAKSTNQGSTFNTSIRVDATDSDSKYPSIAAYGADNVYVAWEDYRDVNSQIRFSKSINGGDTFEVSKNVADSTGDFEQLYPKITKDNNVIHCVWQDSRNANNNSDIYYAYLPQDGNSFSKNFKVNSAPGKTDYGHKYPALAFGNDMIFTAWQGSTEGISGWQVNFSKAKFILQPPTFVQETQVNLPYNFTLYQNYPNPFNPTTNIEYDIPARSHVILKVYNMLGEEVATLVNREQPAGKYIIEFQSKDLSSGIYFYKLQVGNHSNVKKMIIIR